MSSGGVSQKDIRDLELKPQAGLPLSEQLTQLLVLDADQSDFNFRQGTNDRTRNKIRVNPAAFFLSGELYPVFFFLR